MRCLELSSPCVSLKIIAHLRAFVRQSDSSIQRPRSIRAYSYVLVHIDHQSDILLDDHFPHLRNTNPWSTARSEASDTDTVESEKCRKFYSEEIKCQAVDVFLSFCSSNSIRSSLLLSLIR